MCAHVCTLELRAECHPARPGSDFQTFLTLYPSQRAIRVRSHSMETMVGSQRKLHGGTLPGSLSGGIVHNSMEVTKTTFSVSVFTLGQHVGEEEEGGRGVSCARFGLGSFSRARAGEH